MSGKPARPALLAGLAGVAAMAMAAVMLPNRPAPDPALPAEPVTLLLLEGRATQPASTPDSRLALDGAGGVLG